MFLGRSFLLQELVISIGREKIETLICFDVVFLPLPNLLYFWQLWYGHEIALLKILP
jgi:hypothetical protein